MKHLLHILRASGVCFGMLLWLASCSFHSRYSESAQIPTKGWLAGDTLFYPVLVLDSATFSNPIEAHTPYTLRLGVRHTNAFPYRTLSLRFAVEFLDSEGKPAATLFARDILAPLTDWDGNWDGDTWGSFHEKEFTVSSLTLSFPRPGNYRMRLLPLRQEAPLPGLESLTLTIPE